MSAAEPLAGRTDQDGAPLSAVAMETAAERERQGLEPKVTSERALAAIARLVNQSPSSPARRTADADPSAEHQHAKEAS